MLPLDESVGERPHGVVRVANEAVGRADVADERALEQLGRFGHLVGHPLDRRVGRAGLGVDVEHGGEHQRPGGTVDGGVMHLGDLGDAGGPRRRPR